MNNTGYSIQDGQTRRQCPTGSVLGLFLVMMLAGCGPDLAERELETVRVESREVVLSVRARGKIAPLNETEIICRMTGTIARIKEEGARVEEGDIIAELESEAIFWRVIDGKARLAAEKAGAERDAAYAQMRIDGARTSYESEKEALEVARAEFENAKAGMLITEQEKIEAASQVKATTVAAADEARKLGVLSELNSLGVERPTELEEQKVQKELAEIGLHKAKVVFDDVMAGSTEEELKQLELAVLLAEYRLKTAEKRLDAALKHKKDSSESSQRRIEYRERVLKKAEKDSELTVIRAPGPGIVLLKSMWGHKFAAGRYIYQTHAIASIPDLSLMKVELFVNENEIGRIRKGQKAEIRTPSLPGEVLPGVVHSVATIAKDVSQDLSGPDRQMLPQAVRRVTEVEVAIEKADKRLKPGANAEVTIIVGDGAKALVIPKNAVRTRTRVLFRIDSAKRDYLTKGLVATTSSPSLPGVTCYGTFAGIVNDDDETQQRGPHSFGEVRLGKGSDGLKPGMAIVLSIAMTQPEKHTYFPKNDCRLERLHLVTVRDGARDTERVVELGIEDEYSTVVKSGLQEAERVVLCGM